MTRISMKALGLLLLLGISSATRGADAQPTKVFRLSGTAVTPDGAPVAGARVIVFQHATNGTSDFRLGYHPAVPKAADPLTDSQGRFVLDCELPALGYFAIVLEKDGFAPASCRRILCDRFHPRAVGRFVLRALRQIEGRVLDSQGKPVAAAEVFQTGNTHERTATVTGVDGRFNLEGMPDGPAAIFVRKEGFRFHGQFVQPSDINVELTLTRQAEPAVDFKTLPPLLNRTEEQQLSRSLLEPLWNEAIQSRDKTKLWEVGRAYGRIDPWGVLDRLGESNAFVLHSFLHESDPADALALFETELSPASNCRGYLNLLSGVPADDLQRRLDLLDRASRHARAAHRLEARIEYLSEIAIHLFDLGEIERSKELIDELLAEAPGVSTDHTRGCIADALALIDPNGAIRLVRPLQDQGHFEQFNFRIAYRLADRAPALAESQIQRIHARTLLHNVLYRLRLSESHWSYNFNDLKTAAVCYRMAKADLARAVVIAERCNRPSTRAYAKGMIALGLTPRDSTNARKCLLEAFAELENPDRSVIPWYMSGPKWLEVEPGIVAASLLPIAEDIDPALVRELFWRCIGLRPLAPTSRSVTSLDSYANVQMAALLARYDRSVASILMRPYRERLVELAHADGLYLLGTALALIEPTKAPAILRELPTIDGDESSRTDLRLRFVGDFARTLSTPADLRWPAVAARFGFWRPEPEAMNRFNLVW